MTCEDAIDHTLPLNDFYTFTKAIGCSLILLRWIFNADGIGRPSVRHVIICRNSCVASFPVPFPIEQREIVKKEMKYRKMNTKIDNLVIEVEHYSFNILCVFLTNIY